jgi:hypothetical protein
MAFYVLVRIGKTRTRRTKAGSPVLLGTILAVGAEIVGTLRGVIKALFTT